MHKLGHTRSVNCRDHRLHTPDTFIRIPLPSITGGSAVVHTSPAGGSAFTQYTAELDRSGTLASVPSQRFAFVLQGSVEVRAAESATTLAPLTPGGYAYLPQGCIASLAALEPARIAVIEKHYQPHPALPPPPALFSHEDAALAAPLMGDSDVQVRALLPDSPAYDFAVNTMTYQPGATLPMVEEHVMEHGLLMLAGGGIYRLADQWYPVAEGDFIWMAPYCPQWFGALGKTPAKYLIYKDFHRHPHGRPA
ncbi:MAG TPA: (S)-ureidoglycine aminohydrolase [Acidobacteriaceae bacterium]